jgi:hypothetical protein
MRTGAGGGATVVVVITGATVGGGLTTTSGGGTKLGGGGANFGGGGRFSGGGGGGGFTSSMILVSMGPLITSTMRWAKPLSRAQPSNTCRPSTTPMPTICLPGLRCSWPKSTCFLRGLAARAEIYYEHEALESERTPTDAAQLRRTIS